jgi:hypothetical protein
MMVLFQYRLVLKEDKNSLLAENRNMLQHIKAKFTAWARLPGSQTTSPSSLPDPMSSSSGSGGVAAPA